MKAACPVRRGADGKGRTTYLAGGLPDVQLRACATFCGQAQLEEERLLTSVGLLHCKNPGCTNPVPPRKPGHKAQLTCSAACRKAASRSHLLEESRRREEEAKLERLARWEAFQPMTQSILLQVEASGGPALAEALAEAIRCELAHTNVTADLAMRSGHN